MILTTSDPICIARDPSSLEAEWSELARHRAYPTIFLTPDWIRVARAYDRREQITLSIANAHGIAALARADDGAISFAGGELTDYQDIVARPEDVSAVGEALAEWIARNRTPRVRLEFVSEESGTLDAMSPVLSAAGYEVQIDRLVTAPRVNLPDGFEHYMQDLDKKDRHELRRKLRRLETGRRVEYRVADETERAAALDRFVALHRRSRGEKAEFMTEETERFFRDVAKTLAAQGWLRLGVLNVDGEDAAVLFGFAYEGTLALYNAAYDPALASLSVGIACHAYSIRSAIEEGLRGYDFLRGDERYKYDLGAMDHWLCRLEAATP
jgi:CelD/BcsL family acetyltransferase involved in cellulose biosynthesis